MWTLTYPHERTQVIQFSAIPILRLAGGQEDPPGDISSPQPAWTEDFPPAVAKPPEKPGVV